MTGKPWEISADGVVTTVRVKYKPNKEWEHWVLLTGDRHLDNPKSLIDLQKFHLNQCQERGGMVLDIGDNFDAMQGKGDRRSSKSAIREEVKERDYLNSLVKYHYDFYSPYKDILGQFSHGNHETAVLKNLEYDLTRGLVDMLHLSGSPVVQGGFRGWVRFMFDGSGKRCSYNLHYNHGAGGGSPVTRGTIQTARRAVYLPDADIVMAGHIHQKFIMPITRARLTAQGREYKSTQYHVQLPTYKEEFFGTGDGYHHENERPPKPTGAAWIKFYYSGRLNRVAFKVLEADE